MGRGNNTEGLVGIRTRPPSTAVGDPANLLTSKESIARSRSRSGAASEFSFLSIRGLLNFLRSVAESDSTINRFSQTQSVLALQAVPILFRHSLKDSDDEIVCNLDHIFGVEPLKITSPSTDSRVSLAFRLFKG